MNNLQTELAKVTVFRDGARVTRIGKTELGAGPQKVLISGITDYAQEDSFRVKGKGKAALATIDVRRQSVVYEPESDAKQLREKLKELTKKKAQIEDEMATFQTRLENHDGLFIEFAAHFSTIYAADEADLKQLKDLDKKSEELIFQDQKRIHELELELRDLNDEIIIVRDKIGEIDADKRTENFYEVEVTLEVEAKSEVELEVTYQCYGASWIPSYDVDLLEDEAKLRRIALVQNRTREEWDKVDLVVSTATSRPVEAIEASPFIISAYEPRPARSDRAKGGKRKMARKPKAMPSMAPAGGGAAPPPSPPAEIEEEFAVASETVSGISVYEIPNPVTIPFDDERHPITLTEESLDTKTVHYWYTDAMSEVIAQDEVTNGDNVILPGKVKVYADGDYIGETSIGQISPREDFKIGARTAHDVKAKKKLVEKSVEKAGMTRGKLKRSYKYRLEIESFAKSPIEIEVFDRIPHSLNPSIEIKVDWEKIQLVKHELGIMEFKFKIEPGKKKEVTYEYEAQWEQGLVISPPLP